jgi:hypothetical protein
LKWSAAVAAACAVCAAAAHAQTQVVMGDVGAGPSGRLITEALARPHVLIEPDTSWYVVRRGTEVATTLIVLGRSAAVAGAVYGDVIVVGGDLFIRPGARITGNATAIGGGVYASTLGIVEGASRSFRDNTFLVTPSATGYRLDYLSLRERPTPPLLFPGIYGLRFPSYDRVNGASIPFGPSFTVATGRAEANLLMTYRTDLGKIDPSLDVSAELTRRLRARGRAARGTFTNDAWIWSDLVNTMSVLAFGTDTRNYYRADRAELTVHRLWEFSRFQIEPLIGARMERAWSVGPGIFENRGPWSISGRTDSARMWRPNPPVADGRLTTALTGASLDWLEQQLSVKLSSTAEISVASPADERFTQVTADLAVTFPTFGEQEYAMDVRWMTTSGDAAPPQRFAYLGGAGTLPFEELLEQGGDQLLLIDQRYAVPLLSIRLGLLGSPTLLLRHRIGSAGVGRLPAFHEVIGVGALLTLLRAEVQFDPARKQARLSFGFSFSR